MDDDVKQAIDELRAELREAARARTPAARRDASVDVREAREDLEDLLRREGYRLSRRELDALIDEREERRFNERLDRALKEREPVDEPELDAEGNPIEPKKPPVKKPAAKPPKEEEWT